MRLQPGAPHERVRLQLGARPQGDAGRLHGGDDLTEDDVDAPLLEGFLRVALELGLEHREQRRAPLDEGEHGLLLGDVRIVLREVAAIELGQRPGALDAGRPAPDDHDVQRAVVDQGWVPIRRLPLLQDVLSDAHRVGQRVHREGVLLRTFDPEEVDASAQREHQVVVRDRLHLRELHLSAFEVELLRGRLMHPDVRLLVEEVPDRMPDDGRCEQVRRHLVDAAAGRCGSRARRPGRPPRRHPSSPAPHRSRRSRLRGSELDAWIRCWPGFGPPLVRPRERARVGAQRPYVASVDLRAHRLIIPVWMKPAEPSQ